MKRNHKIHSRIIGLILFVSTLSINAAAQLTLAKEKELIDSSDNRWWYTMIFIVLTGLGSAYYFWRKSKKGIEQPQYNYGSRYRDYYSDESYEMNNVDAEKELEWLRKAKKSTTRKSSAKA